MVGDRLGPQDDPRQLSRARSEFLGSLEPRLEQLRAALKRVLSDPEAEEPLSILLRRVHALTSASRVLGFAAMAEQLGSIQQELRRLPRPLPATALHQLQARFAELPELAARTAQRSLRPSARSPHEGVPSRGVRDADSQHGVVPPLAVLLLAEPELETELRAAAQGSGLELERLDIPSHLVDRARAMMPDVIIVDGEISDSSALVRTLKSDASLSDLPVLAIRPAGSLSVAPAPGISTTLTRPLRGADLWHAAQQAVHAAATRGAPSEFPSELNLTELVQRLSHELERALTPLDREQALGQLPIGDGAELIAPLWAALARIRRTINTVSDGRVRFAPAGPEGGIAVEPQPEREDGTSRGHGEGVTLRGRRAVVVDDDPEVVWYISGLLRAAGAEVFEATDGREALTLALARWPDVVVSDVLMPHFDGLALARELRRDPAVRDAPIVFLSWKEDLLLRLRDLGSHADAYLRKEATASSVLRTVAELLAPRSHVAARLAADGEVRGRLDGLSPRLILELTAAHRPNARVTLRDAGYLYEADLRDGALRRVTRRAGDGSIERGERVVRGLLGVSAGRFSVTHEAAPCKGEFTGSLREALAPPLAVLRRALRATRGEQVSRIERIAVDHEAMTHYLAAMPPPARALYRQLAEGASPRALLQSATIPQELLLGVLADVARRGALTAVVGRGGRELLLDGGSSTSEAEAEAEPAPPASAPERHFSFELSPPPPAAKPSAGADQASSPEPSGLGQREPLAEACEAQAESQRPGVPADEFGDEAPTLSWTGAHTSPESASGDSSPSAPELAVEPSIDLAEAVLGAMAESSPPPAVAPAPTARPAELTAPAPTPARGEAGAAPPTAPPRAERDGIAPGTDEGASSTVPQAGSEFSPTLDTELRPSQLPAPARGEPREPTPPPEDRLSAAPPAITTPRGGDVEDEQTLPDALRVSETEAASRAPTHVASDADPRAAADDAPAGAASGRSPEPASDAHPDEANEPEAADQQPAGSSSPSPAEETAGDPEPSAEPPESWSGAGAPGEALPPVAAAPKRRRGRVPEWAVALGTLVGAASITFGLTTTWCSRPSPATAPTPPARRPTDQGSKVPPAVAATPPSPTANSEELPLPDGFELPADKALLEISTGGRHVIYVDGEFVGRGPLRYVPLAPGTHVIRTSLGGEDHENEVTVRASVRTRLQLEAIWK